MNTGVYEILNTVNGKCYPEANAKIVASLRGRKRTPEAIAKMVATKLAKREAKDAQQNPQPRKAQTHE